MAISKYTKRVAAGLCGRCGKHPPTNGNLCYNCRQRQLTLSHSIINNRRSAGLCHRCGEPALPNRARCALHLRLKEEKRLNNKIGGLCDCGGIPSQNRKMCDNCLSNKKAMAIALKTKAIGHYSRGCYACKNCGEKRLLFLTVDHISGGGNKHRQNVGNRFCRWLCRNDFPEGYQILCWNCNHKKHIDSIRGISTSAKSRKQLKQMVIEHYGGICCCCKNNDIDLLTIDHINNDGATQRRLILAGKQATSEPFYRWLRNNNFPTGHQVLCVNCNSGRAINNGICPHKDELKQ